MPKIQTNGSGSVYTVNGSVLLGNTNEPVINSLNITPSTSSQLIIAPTGVDGYNNINVSAVTSSVDQNISAENIKKDISILGVTGTYEGSGGGGGSGTRDVTLTRVSDDSGNEIGTWYMNFKDGSGNIFKVVLLDAQYRNSSAAWCSNTSAVTDMPLYSKLRGSNVWEAGETATQNTQLILDFCSANGYTSTACSHCRSKSFTINGTTYYGQLPNMIEVIHIAKHYHEFDPLDTSASSQPSLILLSSMSIDIWSSNQYKKNTYAFYITYEGEVAHFGKTNTQFVCPVLEIPA